MDKPLIATSSSSSNKRKRKTENAVPTSSTSTNGHGGSGSSSNPKGPTGRNNAKSHDNTIAPVEGVAERRAWAAKHKKDANAHFFQAEVDDAATTSADENENEEELQVAHEKSFGPLLEIIRKSLTERDIVTAKMAFGLLINSEIGGRVVDLRYPGYWDSGFVEYWKLGLEILQTEVEVAEQEQKGNKSGCESQDWETCHSYNRPSQPQIFMLRWNLMPKLHGIRYCVISRGSDCFLTSEPLYPNLAHFLR
ncbi:hypothetical protein V8F06_008425 [Rhypophila decipiens]